MPRFVTVLLVGLVLALTSAGCGADVCGDPNAVLSATAEGQTVAIGTCRVESDITIPSGVTPQGDGRGTVLVGQVTLSPGSSLVDVAVESVENGVEALGAGSGAPVTLRGVTVRAERGVAVRIEGLPAVLEDVVLVGPVDAETAASIPPMPDADETATHGLLLVDAGSIDTPVRLDDVTATGFGRFGALFRNSHVVWNGGGASANLTVGLMAERGSVELVGVDFERNYQGVQPLPAFGAVFTAGVDVSSMNLAVNGNEGYGLLHDDAIVSHVDLGASDNADAAIWVQSGRSFILSGAGSVLAQNRLAGVVLVATPNAMIRDATIDTARLGTRISGEVGMIQVGDGVHAVMDSAIGLVLDGLSLTGNARAGMVIDVADGNLDGAVMDVIVDGTGESLGVIAQGPAGVIPSGTWDADITRLGATSANDAAITDALDIVELIGPMFVPPPAM